MPLWTHRVGHAHAICHMPLRTYRRRDGLALQIKRLHRVMHPIHSRFTLHRSLPWEGPQVSRSHEACPGRIGQLPRHGVGWSPRHGVGLDALVRLHRLFYNALVMLAPWEGSQVSCIATKLALLTTLLAIGLHSYLHDGLGVVCLLSDPCSDHTTWLFYI